MKNKINNTKKIFSTSSIICLILILAVSATTMILALYIKQTTHDLENLKNQLSTLTSDNQQLKEQSETYTVFYADDSQIIKQVSVKKGENVPSTDVPPVPAQNGYFTRWSGIAENVTSDTVIFCEKRPATLQLSGELYVGEKLTVTFVGNLEDKDNITYIWSDTDGNEFFRETTSTGFSEYTLKDSDANKKISVKITKNNFACNTSISNSTDAVSTAQKIKITFQKDIEFSVSITVNDDVNRIFDNNTITTGNSIYLREGDKITVNFDGAGRVNIYSYTTSEPEQSTIIASTENGVNETSFEYTFGTNENVNGYVIELPLAWS